MTNKRIFVENSWTNEALDLERSVIAKLKPLMEEWVSLGYEPHEISHVFMIAAQTIELEARMDLRMKKKEAKDV